MWHCAVHVILINSQFPDKSQINKIKNESLSVDINRVTPTDTVSTASYHNMMTTVNNK